MERFVEVCRRRGLKVNAGKSKVMVLGGEEGLECDVSVDRIRLEYVLELIYLGCVSDESGTDEAECNRMGETEKCYLHVKEKAKVRIKKEQTEINK